MSNIVEQINENIQNIELSNAMFSHYIDYAMSVVVGRALPDVRDGLKPGQRRVLHSMNSMGLFNNKPYKKSARIVGDTLGKYHPHGDQSVYDAMVLLAQDFNTRYPLLDGHGNWGSVDGDSAAAMRYTEVRLSKITESILSDINKNTVDFVPNYDGEELEPSVLPTLFPNLLANGAKGIAVGMATSIPPHNINDIYNALYYIIDQTSKAEPVDINKIIEIIKAPDFPTGGIIINQKEIIDGYLTGRGKAIIRAKYEIEESKKGTDIIITEIPYKINKSELVKQIYDLSKQDSSDKKKKPVLEDLKEIRDESNREGIRIVIELKKDANVNIFLNRLFKHTKLQDSFSIILLALVDGEPKVLNIKEMLEHFLAHAASIIIRRTEFDLEKNNIRLNLVEGVLKCIQSDENIDSTIKIMRESDNPVEDLVKQLGFNKEQAEYIIEMKLRSLTKASEKRLIEEKESLITNISKFTSILNNNSVLLSVMKEEFATIQEKYKDDRKTKISFKDSNINEEDLIKDETFVMTYTTDGLIKNVEESYYKSQKRGGKGTKAINAKEDEIIKFMLTVNSKDDILFFTNEGRCHVLKAYKIEVTSKNARGKSINNYLNLNPGEKVVSMISTILTDKEKSLLFVTKKGIIKRLPLDQLSTRMSTTRVLTIKDEDKLQTALLVSDKDHVIIVTAKGQSLRISLSASGAKTIRPMGRAAAGVTGINVATDDEVVDMAIVNKNDYILTITENGLAKRTEASEWRVIGRGGKGIVAHNLTDKTGNILGVLTANDNDELFIATEQGLITRINAKDIRICGRSTSGVKAINLNDNDKVSSISKNYILEEEEEE